MNIQVSYKDSGYARLLTNVKGAQGAVKVGVSDIMHTKANMPCDELGKFHEFGLGVPQRSFLRGWVDENREAIRRQLGFYTEMTLRGSMTWRAALTKFGEWAVAGIHARMRAHIPPPLAASTVKRKGSDIPLIDTQELYNAIIFELHEKVGS